MSDYHDCNENLAFPPEGDWAETKPVQNTDRTESTIELVNKIEELNKWLDLKSEYIERLEKDKDILIQVLLRHKPELRGWVEKNFKEVDE